MPLFQVSNLTQTLAFLKKKHKLRIIGTDSQARSLLNSTDARQQSMVLVMGSEHTGLKKSTKECCDELVRVPLFSNIVGSLNVATATGIITFEILRQKTLFY